MHCFNEFRLLKQKSEDRRQSSALLSFFDFSKLCSFRATLVYSSMIKSPTPTLQKTRAGRVYVRDSGRVPCLVTRKRSRGEAYRSVAVQTYGRIAASPSSSHKYHSEVAILYSQLPQPLSSVIVFRLDRNLTLLQCSSDHRFRSHIKSGRNFIQLFGMILCERLCRVFEQNSPILRLL